MAHAIDRIVTGQVTVTGTAAQVVDKRRNRRGVMFIKRGSEDLFLGCANVTTSNGLLFAGACGAFVTLPTTDEVWAISASGSIVVTYVESYDA